MSSKRGFFPLCETKVSDRKGEGKFGRRKRRRRRGQRSCQGAQERGGGRVWHQVEVVAVAQQDVEVAELEGGGQRQQQLPLCKRSPSLLLLSLPPIQTPTKYMEVGLFCRVCPRRNIAEMYRPSKRGDLVERWKP